VVDVLAIVETVWRSVETPFFKRRVTGPVAFDQVMSNGVPAATPTKSPGVLVICAALATAKAAAATRTDENCILMIEGIDGTTVVDLSGQFELAA
jgi:hypothetical protein